MKDTFQPLHGVGIRHFKFLGINPYFPGVISFSYRKLYSFRVVKL